MKWLLMLGITFFYLGSGICSENEKIYVSPEQVYVGSEGIQVNFLGKLFQVNGLFRDHQGLHVRASEVIDEQTFSWTCPYGHPSDGSGRCTTANCPFQKK